MHGWQIVTWEEIFLSLSVSPVKIFIPKSAQNSLIIIIRCYIARYTDNLAKSPTGK
jgi:hypothetical protein